MTALDIAMGLPWAIHEPALHTILEIAQRLPADPALLEKWKVSSDIPAPEAVAARRGSWLEGTNAVEMRGDVAVVTVRGPIFRYANMITEFSGATALSTLARDFMTARESAQAASILLAIDSPGGEANGIAEFAQMVRDAAAVKPVTAYVGGIGASAAYWIAAAAGTVVTAPTALLGSIGVVTTLRDTRARDEKAGIRSYDIVSSQSPKKRLDPSTDDGRSDLQAIVDRLAAEFVGTVATYRGATPETVLAEFGRGGVLIGSDAVAVGMADRVGSFESTLASMASRNSVLFSSPAALAGLSTPKETKMADPQHAPDPASQQPTQAPPTPQTTRSDAEIRADERARCGAILDADEAKGRDSLARHLAFGTAMGIEEAKAILKASPATQAHAGANAFAQAMGAVANPKVGVDAGSTAEDEQMASMLALGKSFGICG